MSGARVSFLQLGILALAFTCGVAIVLLVQNSIAGATVTFSTTSIISFVVGIALSAASIVLAVAAISLGKTSERAMIDRSDQSIRLQNEVFTRTTEALARIESSTGTTEKRIEDIIAGRAGDMAHRLSEDLIESGASNRRSRKDLEAEIRRSLSREFNMKMAQEEGMKAEAQRNEAEAAYDTFRERVLLRIADSPVTSSQKFGSGQFGAEGDDLYDGIFSLGDKRIGVCVIATSQYMNHSRGFFDLLTRVARSIGEDSFGKALIVFDGNVKDTIFENENNRFISVTKNDLSDKIDFVSGSPDQVVESVIKMFAIPANGT